MCNAWEFEGNGSETNNNIHFIVYASVGLTVECVYILLSKYVYQQPLLSGVI